MRQTSVKIDGVEYPLCYSVRVVRAAVERFGSLEAMGKAAFAGEGAESVDARLWLLAQEMDAGARYAKRCGLDSPAPLTEEEILDSVPGLQIAELLNAAVSAMVESSATSIDAEPPESKNAGATPGE